MSTLPYATWQAEHAREIQRLAAEQIRRERQDRWLASLLPEVRNLYLAESGRR